MLCIPERITDREPFLPVNPDLGHPENDEYRWMPFDKMESSMPGRLMPVVQWVKTVG